MSILSATEARNLAEIAVKENYLVARFFELVETEAKSGANKFNYSTNGVYFTKTERDLIENLGYSLSWNRATLWYEVEW